MSKQTLSKSELVAAIAVKQPDLSKKAIAEVVRAARNGRNPRTGETVQIAASVAPKFSPGKVLRSAVAGK